MNRYRESFRSDWRTVIVEPKGGTSITIYNLLPNTSYDFRVFSRNILGESGKSAIVKATTESTSAFFSYICKIETVTHYSFSSLKSCLKTSPSKELYIQLFTLLKLVTCMETFNKFSIGKNQKGRAYWKCL